MLGGTMTNKINDETLERLYEDVVADDEAGLIDDVINNVAYLNGLDADDDRDEILQLIAEEEFYDQFT
jgi:hypothetical protein